MNRSTDPSKGSPASSATPSGWRPSKRRPFSTSFRKSLRQALADHQAMLGVLLQRRTELPLELGELFEDAGNAYMEMSERVSQKFLTARNHTPG